MNVIGACRSIGLEVSEAKERALIQDLQNDFEQAVRDEFARQEQGRIGQIRDEERLAREIDRQIKDADAKRQPFRLPLIKPSKKPKTSTAPRLNSYEPGYGKRKEGTARFAAQLTKAGHVYVLSNIGSFGEGLYKIGMTRRLEPEERVNELSSASVPFPFDVHMMISCDDAPSLENALHREFHRQRVNKVNFRKEFARRFRRNTKGRRVATRRVEDISRGTGGKPIPRDDEHPDEDYDFVERTVASAAADAGGSPGDEE